MRLLVVKDPDEPGCSPEDIGMEDIEMAGSESDFIETPDSCEEKTEYDNIILDSLEIEPEEEQEETGPRSRWDEIEQKFARYERNYRARRIREMTRTPVIITSKRGRGRPRKLAA